MQPGLVEIFRQISLPAACAFAMLLPSAPVDHQISAIKPAMTSLERALRDFAQFAAKLKGDEKSEAQTFLFHLLAAFGHDANTLPEGSTFEYRVRFPGERTKFADLVWPGRCLIEMKSRGVKLSKHYQQTFDYWLNILPLANVPVLA
jgi:hypothetical protein